MVFTQNLKRDMALKRDRVQHDLNVKRWDVLDPQLNQQVVPKALEALRQQ